MSVAALALCAGAASACSEDEPTLPNSNGGSQQNDDPPFRDNLDGDGTEETGGTTRPPPQPNGDAVGRGLGGGSAGPYPQPGDAGVDGGTAADAGDAG